MKSINLLIIMIFILVASIAPVFAAEEPQEITTGLYIINLGKFDISSGAFTADFYLSFDCSVSCKNMSFEFLNGRASSIDKIEETSTSQFYRIQAQLTSPVDLKRFPFDSQEMQIVIEDKKATIDELVYVPDKQASGIDEDVQFPGWTLSQWTAKETTHPYPVYDEEYSRYVFSIPIERIKINAIFKTLLPIFFIVFVMLSSFFLDPDKITTRLGMVGSSLVASVMFHISISNQIPPVGYLTFADKFMVITYFIILLTFIMNIIMLELQEKKIKPELVMKIHRYTEYTSIPLAVVIYILLFIFGL